MFRFILILSLTACSWVPQPGHAPSPAPSGTPVVLDVLGQTILTYNNSQDYWVGGVTQWTVPAKGVTVNKINPAQAGEEAQDLEATVPSDAPMSVALALLASESILDPNCVNGNLGPGESNTDNNPWGYDDGVAQLKLKYIVTDAPFVTPGAAAAFAFNPAQAIPYFWGLYESHLATADSWIAAGGPSTIDPRLMDRYILAAVIYKQGDTGAYTIFKAGVWPAELNNFVSLEQYFAGKLGTKSVFGG